MRSLDVARGQGALSWELRVAIGIAGLKRKQRQTEQTRNLLGTVYARFTEGFDTGDLKQAKQLLDELQHAHQARSA